jgi:hypothetical protein
VSDEHWALVREENETKGYDREAYEYEVEIGRRSNPASTKTEANRVKSDARKDRYLVKRRVGRGEGGFTHDIIREASETKKLPEVEERSCEDGDARLCCGFGDQASSPLPFFKG